MLLEIVVPSGVVWKGEAEHRYVILTQLRQRCFQKIIHTRIFKSDTVEHP